MHARALLGDDEFAAGEIAFRFREQYCDLEREDMLTVEVLVQAVVIAGTVLEQQRGGPCLSGDVATVEKGRVVTGKTDIDPERVVPAVGDFCERRIERCTQRRDVCGQRIGEVCVLSAMCAVG